MGPQWGLSLVPTIHSSGFQRTIPRTAPRIDPIGAEEGLVPANLRLFSGFVFVTIKSRAPTKISGFPVGGCGSNTQYENKEYRHTIRGTLCFRDILPVIISADSTP